MKKLLFTMFMLLSFTGMMAQQITHTIQRGETIESIASKYNVSVDALKKANPDISEMFFVGLKLNIPTPKDNRETTNKISADNQLESKMTQMSNDTQAKNYDVQPILNNAQSETNGLIAGMDFTFMLNPDIKTYGIRMNWNGLGYKWISMDWGMLYQFVSHGTYSGYMGFGLSPKYAYGPILVGIHLYPYVNLYSKYEQTGTYEKTGKPKFEDKTKVGYGGALDLMAGLQLFTTKKGAKIYLTGSYHVDAFEFKTEGAFKNGMWGFGITVVAPE